MPNPETTHSVCLLCPILAPLLGGLLGAFTYDFLIGRALSREQLKEAYRQEMQRSEF